MPKWFEGFKRPVQIGFCVAITMAVISIFLPNYYKSEAMLLPVDSKGGSGSLASLASAAAALGVAVPGGDSTDNNLVDIVESRWLRERLLQPEFQFTTKRWFFGKEQEHTESLFKYLHVKNVDKAVDRLDSVLRASRDTKTKVIKITAETESPMLSQELVQTSLHLLETFVQEKGRTRGGAKAIFAGERLTEAREDMAKAENDMRDFLDGNRNVQTSNEPSIRLKGARLEAELKLRMQLVATLSLSREQALMDEKNDVPILNVLDNGNLPIEKSAPHRSVITLLAFFLATAGAWAYLNRRWIGERLMEADRHSG